MAEALALLHDLAPTAPAGGPGGDRAGRFWVELPERHLGAAVARLPRLGYRPAVDLVAAAPPAAGRARAGGGRGRGWPGWRLVRLHTEDAAGHREQAPDRREFLVEGGDGRVRPGHGCRVPGRVRGRRRQESWCARGTRSG